MASLTLTVSNGTWTNSPTSFTYSWEDCDAAGANCSPIAGASASAYVLALTDIGDTLAATVTATNAGGSSTVLTAATGLIGALLVAPPQNTVAPAISGSTVQGQTLSVSNGTWSGSPSGFAYAWKDCDASRQHARPSPAGASSYVLAVGDVGDTIEAVVTATNAGGSTSATRR